MHLWVAQINFEDSDIKAATKAVSFPPWNSFESSLINLLSASWMWVHFFIGKTVCSQPLRPQFARHLPKIWKKNVDKRKDEHNATEAHHIHSSFGLSYFTRDYRNGSFETSCLRITVSCVGCISFSYVAASILHMSKNYCLGNVILWYNAFFTWAFLFYICWSFIGCINNHDVWNINAFIHLTCTDRWTIINWCR